MDMPKQVQDKISQFQGLQNQMQAMVLQKQQMVLQSADIGNALAALEKIDKEKLYKAIGPLFIEAGKEETEKKLKEDKELLDTRVKILEKQEKKLVDKLKELSVEIQSDLQGGALSG